MKKKKNIFRVLVLLLICLCILGIYKLKTQEEAQAILCGKYDTAVDEYNLIAESINYESMFASAQPVIVDYGKKNCPVCLKMSKNLKKYNQELHGKAFLKFIDVSSHPEELEALGISFPPLQVFFTNTGCAYIPSEKASAEISFSYIAKDSDGVLKESAASDSAQKLLADGFEILYTFHRGELSSQQLKLILNELGVYVDE